MKKLSLSICALLLLILITFSGANNVYAKEIDFKEDNILLGKNSVSSILINADDGEIIFKKNETEKRPIASMTKIMTLLIVYQNIESGKLSLEDEVTISANASSMGGSQAFLDTNSVHKVKDLIKTIIVASANDSCVALAEHLSGSVENFVSEMNKKAQALNLKATNFVNCTGLPAVNQYSCAIDCATMFSALIKQNNNYFEYSKIWTDDYAHPSGRVTSLTNTNKLVKFYDGCDGGKTGYTNEAQHCLCATAKRGDTRFISCVLGEPDSKTRFAEVSQMFNYGFANYSNSIYLSKDKEIDVSVKNGQSEILKVRPQNNLSAFLKKSDTKEDIKVEFSYSKLSAPFSIGETVGKAFLVRGNNIIAETPLISAMDMKEKTYFDQLYEIIKEW